MQSERGAGTGSSAPVLPATDVEPATLRVLSSPRAGGAQPGALGSPLSGMNATVPSPPRQAGALVSMPGSAPGRTTALGHPMTLGPALPDLFVYPLDEYTTVIGFGGHRGPRVVTVQIKDKAKIEGGHFEATGIRLRPSQVRAGGAVAGPGHGWSLAK